MTMTVTGMRSNKPVTMDIEQLRGWATFMDRAMIASLIATIVAVAALGITTWLSFRFSGAVRAHEYAAIHRYKVEMGKHAAELEQEVSRSRERTLELEQAASDADARAAQAARESAAAAEKARTAEIDAEEVRKRVAELGKQVREATARAPDPARGCCGGNATAGQAGGGTRKRRAKSRGRAIADRREPEEVCRHQGRRVRARRSARRSGGRQPRSPAT